MTPAEILHILSSIPNNNHYLLRYHRFISMCLKHNELRKIDSILEKHHICPKSLFPDYKEIRQKKAKYKWNCANLTPRQHFIAHWILWKAFGSTQAYAFISMCGRGKGKINSKLYEKLRIENSGKNHMYSGKTFTERYGVEKAAEILHKMSGDNASSKTKKARENNSASKQNRGWINNGTIELWVDLELPLPDFYTKGRMNHSSTIVESMTTRSLKSFGYENLETLRTDLTEEVKQDKRLYWFEKKYVKDNTCKFRDPSIKYFLKYFDLWDKLKHNRNKSLLGD